MPLDDTKPKREKPEPEVLLPSDEKGLLRKSLEIIEQCRASQGMRAAYCRQLYQVIQTGRQDGTRSLINMLYQHHDRLASHLFSPSELRFTMDYENDYPDDIMKRGQVAAKILTREWERDNSDILFGAGVFEGLQYGAAVMKQWPQMEGEHRLPTYYSTLVMPWQFAVYREDLNDLDRQPAMVETIPLSMPEVWRRIAHLPGAKEMFARIRQNSRRGDTGENQNFFHQILSTSTLNVSNTGLARPQPGGIVNLNNDPNYSIIGPQIDVDMAYMHELWVWDGDDYTTVQLIEPDILIAPLFKRINLLIQNHGAALHPYTLIQPNRTQGYIWGRPEVVDLLEPQGWLSTTADDIKRLFGLQVDKILSFTGYDGLTDEVYDERRAAGYFNLPQGGAVNDVTPKFPDQSLQMIELQMKLIDRLGGFDNLMSGRGEPGVRAGNQANMMLKTASPRLRDRSLLVERQCAQAADLRLHIMEAKDPRNYWTDGTSLETMKQTEFRLEELPADRRVSVDSHSSSPIFADDHANLIGWGVKSGFVDGESAIENLPFPEKEVMIRRYKERQKQQQQLTNELLKRDPQALEKMLGKKH